MALIHFSHYVLKASSLQLTMSSPKARDHTLLSPLAAQSVPATQQVHNMYFLLWSFIHSHNVNIIRRRARYPKSRYELSFSPLVPFQKEGGYSLFKTEKLRSYDSSIIAFSGISFSQPKNFQKWHQLKTNECLVLLRNHFAALSLHLEPQ